MPAYFEVGFAPIQGNNKLNVISGGAQFATSYLSLWYEMFLYVLICILVSLFRWVNRKDPGGKNIFSGGFLGLDNIGKVESCLPA